MNAQPEQFSGDLPQAFGSDLPQLLGTGHNYRYAPIIEAVIDLRVDLADDVSAADLTSIIGPHEPFSTAKPIYEIDDEADWEENTLTTARTVVGYSYSSDDGTAVVRYRTDRFSFSLLPPYTTWELFLATAEPLWERFRERARPERVTSVGVRFVNSIVVPKVGFEVKDYLRTSVEISPYLPQAIQGFRAEVVIPLQRYEAVAVVTATHTDWRSRDSTALILDIDIRAEAHLDTADAGFAAALDEMLGRLRHAKNYVFESCITDATRNLIS